MRRALLLTFAAAALAACTPDIPSGSYLCGPDEACPEGQACDGPTNACVTASVAQAFACDPMVEHDDSTPQTATALPALGCVSAVYAPKGCLANGDAHDWYQFTTPSTCTAVEVEINLAYPVSFEPLAIVLADANGTELATDTACKGISSAGEDQRCLTQTLTPGGAYTIEVKPLGSDDCDGACAFNRYTISVQLATP